MQDRHEPVPHAQHSTAEDAVMFAACLEYAEVCEDCLAAAVSDATAACRPGAKDRMDVMTVIRVHGNNGCRSDLGVRECVVPLADAIRACSDAARNGFILGPYEPFPAMNVSCVRLARTFPPSRQPTTLVLLQLGSPCHRPLCRLHQAVPGKEGRMLRDQRQFDSSCLRI